VIDLLEQPQIAKRDQVLATPKVVRWYPTPRRTVIGTLSDAARVLDGLSVTQDP
jgi:circadian clock protein KaiB